MALTEKQLLAQARRLSGTKRGAFKVRGPRTKEIDHGFKGIIKELKKLEKKPYVKIGYPAESKKTDAQKEQMVRAGGENLAIVESEFVTVLDVAIFHEFGTVHMPQRSFIRASFDQNRKKYEDMNKKLLIKIYSGKMTVNKALDILGLTIQNDIKTFLASGEVNPESERAILEGGNTLVDTAQLLNSITYIKVMSS